MNGNGLLIERKDDQIIISFNIDTLCHAIESNDQWKGVFIVEKDLLCKNFIYALQREEEDGTTPVHQLLDDTIKYMLEWCDESLEFKE